MTATKSILIVKDGVVVDSILVPGDATVRSGNARVEWTEDGLDAPDGAKFRDQPGAGIGWTVSGLTLVAPEPEPDPAPSVPQSVSRAQAKIALHRAGLLDLVKTAVAADPEVQIWFEDATVWDRNNPHVVALGEQLIGDSAGVDALFIQAAQIAA